MRLDQIDKKNIFEVPEGYFDKLPMAIQERVAQQQKVVVFPAFAISLKFAFPVLFVTIATVFVYQNLSRTTSPEQSLKDVNTETLVAYLNESEITEDEILESINHDQIEFQSSPAHALESINIEDTTLEKLSKDFENEYF